MPYEEHGIRTACNNFGLLRHENNSDNLYPRTRDTPPRMQTSAYDRVIHASTLFLLGVLSCAVLQDEAFICILYGYHVLESVCYRKSFIHGVMASTSCSDLVDADGVHISFRRCELDVKVECNKALTSLSWSPLLTGIRSQDSEH